MKKNKQIRKKYSTPKVKVIDIILDEAYSFYCKNTGRGGPYTTCEAGASPCATLGGS